MFVTATTDRPCETIDFEYLLHVRLYVWRILTYLLLFLILLIYFYY